MRQVKEDKEREERIYDEAIVDAYDEDEKALGWYYYLEDRLNFPFKARCTVVKRISPLRKDEVVQVVEMPSEDDCMHEMFVEVDWQGRRLAVPLSQLEPVDVDEDTEEAVGDWHYWVARGYQF